MWGRKANESGVLLYRYDSQQFENLQKGLWRAHFKKWLEAVPQEGSEEAPTDHQWDFGSYLSLEFWKIIMLSESLTKGLIPENFRMYISF